MNLFEKMTNLILAFLTRFIFFNSAIDKFQWQKIDEFECLIFTFDCQKTNIYEWNDLTKLNLGFEGSIVSFSGRNWMKRWRTCAGKPIVTYLKQVEIQPASAVFSNPNLRHLQPFLRRHVVVPRGRQRVHVPAQNPKPAHRPLAEWIRLQVDLY